MDNPNTHMSDVLIVGGGLVGAAAAVAFAQQGHQVTLVDKHTPIFTQDNTQWDSRIYALSPGNVAWLKTLGVWDKLDANRTCDIDQMHIWGDDTTSPLIFDAYEANTLHLGVVIESHQLHQALWQTMQALDVRLVIGQACARLTFHPQYAELQLADNMVLRAALMIGADGGQSWVRAQAQISTKTHQYQQQAVVANFETTLPHQHIARQWFDAHGVLAYLPLPGNRMSMVWSTPQAARLMALSAQELAAEVSAAGQTTLGALTLITPPACFSLVKQSALAMVKPRLALVGDAAHRIHPLAGQGVNLGFRDVITLLESLNARNPYQDLGDFALLRQFERARKRDVLSLGSLTHGLQWLFENQLPSVQKIRNVGLGLTQRQAWLKRLLIQHAII